MLIYKSSLGVECKMTEGFTQKEMLIRILDKIEKMDEKIVKVNVKIEETHTLAAATNGKVRLNTKSIYALYGALVTVAGWFVYHLMNSIN